MPAPSLGPYDNFGSDGTYPAGSNPWNGQPNTITPSTGFITRGFMAGEKFVTEYLNFFLRNLYLWIAWLNTSKLSITGSAVDNRLVRWDGTTGALVQGGPVAESDTGSITGVENLTLSGDVLYTTPKTRTAILHVGSLSGNVYPSDGWVYSAVGRTGSQQASNVGSGGAALQLQYSIADIIHDGESIVSISCNVDPGLARSGTDRMSIDMDTGSGVETEYDDGTASNQTITLTFSSPVLVDKAANPLAYCGFIKAGNSAHTDNLYGAIKVVLSVPGLKP